MTQEAGVMTGRVALVSGTSQGYGGAVARALAAEGADIAFCHPSIDAGAEETAAAVSALGRTCFHRACDIVDVESGRHFVAQADGTLGPIDILVNDTGTSRPDRFERRTFQEFEYVKAEDFDRVIGARLRSAFFMTQAVYPLMKQRRWGRIINISSVPGDPSMGASVHAAAARAGLMGFTRALEREAAPHGVLAFAIDTMPGEDTALGDGSRSPVDIARLAVNLAASGASGPGTEGIAGESPPAA